MAIAKTFELVINGMPALATSLGVRMGDDFLDHLTEPLELKDWIENECRLESGKRVLRATARPCFKSRDVDLTFTIAGDDKAESPAADFLAKKAEFLKNVYEGNSEEDGLFTINVPALGTEVYRLIYKGVGSEYGMNRNRTFCKMTLKFEEPNPAKRSATVINVPTGDLDITPND